MCYNQKCKVVSLNLAHPVLKFDKMKMAWFRRKIPLPILSQHFINTQPQLFEKSCSWESWHW